jgi:hypothetical protein
MFGGNFAEGEQQLAKLSEMEGVKPVRGFEALIQWLYIRRIHFDSKGPGDQVSAAIELVRLADLCNITGMESEMAQHIKDILVANPDPGSKGSLVRRVDTNTYCLTHYFSNILASWPFSAWHYSGSLG